MGLKRPATPFSRWETGWKEQGLGKGPAWGRAGGGAGRRRGPRQGPGAASAVWARGPAAGGRPAGQRWGQDRVLLTPLAISTQGPGHDPAAPPRGPAQWAARSPRTPGVPARRVRPGAATPPVSPVLQALRVRNQRPCGTPEATPRRDPNPRWGVCDAASAHGTQFSAARGAEPAHREAPPRALPVWLPGPERGHRAGDSVSTHTLLHVGARRVWRPVKRRRKTQPGDGWGGRRAPRCRHTVRGRRQVRGRAGSSLFTRHVRGAAGRLCAWSPGGQPPGHLGRRQMSPASLSLRYNSALPWSWLGKGPLSPGPAPRGLSVSCPARCFSTAASWGGERKWGSAQHTSGPACAAWRPRPLPVKAGAAPAGAHPTQEARWW